jgi:hypothetical protein
MPRTATEHYEPSVSGKPSSARPRERSSSGGYGKSEAGVESFRGEAVFREGCRASDEREPEDSRSLSRGSRLPPGEPCRAPAAPTPPERRPPLSSPPERPEKPGRPESRVRDTSSRERGAPFPARLSLPRESAPNADFLPIDYLRSFRRIAKGLYVMPSSSRAGLPE